VRSIPLPPRWTLESSFDVNATSASDPNEVRPRLSCGDRKAVAEFGMDAAMTSPTTKSATIRRHGWEDAMHAERWREWP